MDGTIVLAVGFWLAFFGARLIRAKGVPELVGFLVVGAAIGPSGSGLVSGDVLEALKPVAAIATAVLMFGIGERLSPRELKVQRFSVPAGLLSSSFTVLLVWPLARLAGARGAEAMLLAILAAAGAPMTITALAARARSPYSAGLIGAHAVSDSAAALAFSLALPLALMVTERDATAAVALRAFLGLGPGSLAVGVVIGLVMCRLVRDSDAVGDAMVVMLVHMVVLAVVVHALDGSIPLAALVAGVLVATRVRGEPKVFVFKSVQRIEEPLFLVFFTLAGAAIHLDLLAELGLLGTAYLVGRSSGKVLGGLLGGKIARLGTRDAALLGVDMLPQAGSAVALVVMATDLLPGIGPNVAVVVLGAIVVFEATTPLLTARNLRRLVPPEQAAPAVAPSHTQPDPPSVVTADYPPPAAVRRELNRSDE